jgi:hypothetical protein
MPRFLKWYHFVGFRTETLYAIRVFTIPPQSTSLNYLHNNWGEVKNLELIIDSSRIQIISSASLTSDTLDYLYFF